ncbi:MAG: beta-ketoacyl-[acyl-carrier-protein] synthase family protein [Chthoniobacterales bacterium]|nr:beta-ketoacyl-[acyl-carrier-protein] synthase family protein [Chthoniobacterales bacterium]
MITGMGVLAPNGTGLKAFWKSLVAGESGIGPITLFDATEFKSRIAGEVKDFDPLDYMDAQWKPKRLARHTQLAFAATQMALRDAGFDPRSRRLGSALPVCLGVSTSAIDLIENGFHELKHRGPNRVNSLVVRNGNPQAAAQLIAEKLGVETHATTICSACPSGIDAIAMAATRIRSGDAEVALAGGADAPITPLTMASLSAAGLSSMANSRPMRASRPYDKESDSGVISEGAGMLVLENLDHAVARGAQVYLEITGYAAQMDHDPEEPFGGMEGAMRISLANASRRADEVDYICSYGPGHPALDAAEVRAVRSVFGAAADRMPVSSIKGVTGNPLAACGPLQVIACALAFKHDVIPPTANLQVPSFGCDLDFVPMRSRQTRLNCALVNVRGLGGGNSSMILERVGAESDDLD